jgi:monoamine oxidase
VSTARNPDVVVIGAGLAGLSCARDLASGGADVLVLEARDVVGGRTPCIALGDVRVDGGGELVGGFHEPLRQLVAELGLELEPSYAALPGATTWLVDGRRVVGEEEALIGATHAASLEDLHRALLEASREIDAARPWTHPKAAELDAQSIVQWARERGISERALDVVRLSHLSMSSDAPERTSVLSELRRYAAGGFYDLRYWERDRVVGGTFQVAQRLAGTLAGRIRRSAPVVRIARVPGGVEVELAGGELVRAEGCVSTIPAGCLHAVELSGLDPARLRALRRLRQARAAKVVTVYERSFWLEAGQTGLSYSDGLMGSTWEQRPGVLSALVPPERLGYFGAMSPERRREEVLDHLAALFGEEARRPLAMWERLWGEEPYTRGYVTQHAPGDLTAMGDLLAASDGPFHVAGSDFGTIAGYMTAAVETGRATAASLLRSPEPASAG